MYAGCVVLIMESMLIGEKAVNIQIHPAPGQIVVYPLKHLIGKKDRVHIGEDPTRPISYHQVSV
jgi:hypothetical protein